MAVLVSWPSSALGALVSWQRKRQDHELLHKPISRRLDQDMENISAHMPDIKNMTKAFEYSFKSSFTALRCLANRSTPNLLRAMTTRTLHEIVCPDNLRHPSHLLQPYIPWLASSFHSSNPSSVREFNMGWFWADTAPAAPAARVAPHAMPRGSMEPPVRAATPHSHAPLTT
jgi:hypothetical protein